MLYLSYGLSRWQCVGPSESLAVTGHYVAFCRPTIKLGKGGSNMPEVSDLGGSGGLPVRSSHRAESDQPPRHVEVGERFQRSSYHPGGAERYCWSCKCDEQGVIFSCGSNSINPAVCVSQIFTLPTPFRESYLFQSF